MTSERRSSQDNFRGKNSEKTTKYEHKLKLTCRLCTNWHSQEVRGQQAWSITNLIIWQVPRAGKMNQIALCDWLPERVIDKTLTPSTWTTLMDWGSVFCPPPPERARWSHLAHSGLPAVSRKKNFPESHYNKSFIDQVCSFKMAGYWPCSFFASLRTTNSSRSINTQKKNLANIQPS